MARGSGHYMEFLKEKEKDSKLLQAKGLLFHPRVLYIDEALTIGHVVLYFFLQLYSLNLILSNLRRITICNWFVNSYSLPCFDLFLALESCFGMKET